MDIEDTLVSKVEVNCLKDLVQLKMEDNFKIDYIVLQEIDSVCDCSIEGCACKIEVYKIRPYALELMRAIRPFLEVIAFTNWPEKKLSEFLRQFEEVLN